MHFRCLEDSLHSLISHSLSLPTMSSTSHFSSSNEPAFGPHPRPHVPTDAACERCGGVLKAPFQVRKGEQLENWGRWLQIVSASCFTTKFCLTDCLFRYIVLPSHPRRIHLAYRTKDRHQRHSRRYPTGLCGQTVRSGSLWQRYSCMCHA